MISRNELCNTIDSMMELDPSLSENGDKIWQQSAIKVHFKLSCLPNATRKTIKYIIFGGGWMICHFSII